jgi:uncharacterized protein (UPF0254 family)
MMLQEVAAKWFRWKIRPKSGGHDVARSGCQVVYMKEKAKKVAVMMLREVTAKWFTSKRRPKKWRTWCCKKLRPSGLDEREGQKSGGHDVAKSGGQVVQMKEQAKKVAVMMLREVVAKWFIWKRRPKKWRSWCREKFRPSVLYERENQKSGGHDCCEKLRPSGLHQNEGQKSGGHDVARSYGQVVYIKTKAKKVAVMMSREVPASVLYKREGQKSGGHDVARSCGQVV